MTVHVALHLRATLTALERPRAGEALGTRGGALSALGAGAARRRQRPRLVSPLIFWGSMETMHWDAQAHAEPRRLGGATARHPWLREAPPPKAPGCTTHSGRGPNRCAPDERLQCGREAAGQSRLSTLPRCRRTAPPSRFGSVSVFKGN